MTQRVLLLITFVAVLLVGSVAALWQARNAVQHEAIAAWQSAQLAQVDAIALRVDQQLSHTPTADLSGVLMEEWAWLVDDQGRIAAHPDKEQIGSRPFAPDTDDPRLTEMLAAMRRGERGSTSYGWVVPETGKRQARLASYAPAGPPGWGVAVSAEQHHALAGLERAVAYAFGATMTVLFGFVLLAIGLLLLANRSQRREVALANERLIMTTHAAHADRLALIGSMSAGVAHDLRSPLTAVKLAVEVLEESLEGTEDAPVVRDLTLATNQLLMLAEDLTRFSGRQADEDGPRSADPAAALQVALRLCPPARDGRVVPVNLEVPPVAMAPDRLSQVFVNLLANGAAFGTRLEVGGACDGRGVKLWVDDDGPGVPEADRTRVFEAFMTGREGGTGLGLHLCQRLVREVGGELRCEQAPLGGARFLMELPLA